MIVIGTDIVETYFKSRAGHRGIKAARAQYDAWLAIAETADWKTPEEVKKAQATPGDLWVMRAPPSSAASTAACLALRLSAMSGACA